MPEPKSGVLPITPQGKTRKIYMVLPYFVNEVFNKKTFFNRENASSGVFPLNDRQRALWYTPFSSFP